MYTMDRDFIKAWSTHFYDDFFYWTLLNCRWQVLDGGNKVLNFLAPICLHVITRRDPFLGKYFNILYDRDTNKQLDIYRLCIPLNFRFLSTIIFY